MRREEDPGTASRKAKGLSAVFRRMKEADGTPDSPWNGFAFRLFRCRMGGKQEPVIDDAPLRGAGVPYVMLQKYKKASTFRYIYDRYFSERHSNSKMEGKVTSKSWFEQRVMLLFFRLVCRINGFHSQIKT